MFPVECLVSIPQEAVLSAAAKARAAAQRKAVGGDSSLRTASQKNLRGPTGADIERATSGKGAGMQAAAAAAQSSSVQSTAALKAALVARASVPLVSGGGGGMAAAAAVGGRSSVPVFPSAVSGGGFAKPVPFGTTPAMTQAPASGSGSARGAAAGAAGSAAAAAAKGSGTRHVSPIVRAHSTLARACSLCVCPAQN